MKKIISIVVVLTAIIKSAIAVPAFTEAIKFTQPGREGVTVTIYMRGDERVHWAETMDGYSLLYDDEGRLMYATKDAKGDMTASEYMATEIEARSAEVAAFLKNTPKRLRYSQRQVDELLKIWEMVERSMSKSKTMSDVSGEKKFLVILFAFQDKSFTYGKYAFKKLFNQVNYSSYGSSGSVHDYYYEVSGGLFSLKVDLAGPYTGQYDLSHYGNTDYGYQDFATEAVAYASNDVNFADYDNDHDGYIDGLHIIFAGYGEEAGGGADCIWSHKWNIFSEPEYDNTIVNVYSCSPELSGNAGSDLTAIGVICHELGHVFGAPDYYDTDYAGSGGEYPGLGRWDIMSGGSWNHGGKTPAQHNPYTKLYIYGWSTCDTLTNTPGVYTMEPISRSNNAIHRVNTSTQGDFFLIENRQQENWDEYVPGHGMLVYHVHPNASGASVSNYRHPQEIFIMAAGSVSYPTSVPSSYGAVNSVNATLPGESKRDTLTENSKPWLRPWSGASTGISLRDISDNTESGLLYFTIGQKAEVIEARAEGLTVNSVAIGWKRYGSYRTLVVRKENDGSCGVPDRTYASGDTLEGGGVVVYYGNGNKCTDLMLENNSQYSYRIFVRDIHNNYSTGTDVEATTLDCEGEMWTEENFEQCENGKLPSCWSGNWGTAMWNGNAVATPTGHNEQGYAVLTSRPLIASEHKNMIMKMQDRADRGCMEGEFIVEYRTSISDEWDTVARVESGDINTQWEEHYAFLTNVGDGSKIRISTEDNGIIYINNITLTEGNVLLEATASGVGGTIEPNGALITDTVPTTFEMHAEPGYKLKSVSYDGEEIALSELTKTGEREYSYTLTPTIGRHSLLAAYMRNTAIEEAEGNDRMKVYPTPSAGIITIETECGMAITIYDMTGKEITKITTMSGKETLDISHWSKGVYVVKSGDSVKKIVKK